MAQEINLSSREWCDLVFEGKNKDFGAYVIRTESTKRHNLAVLWALVGSLAVTALTFGLIQANKYLEERRLASQHYQTEVFVDLTAEEPEPEKQIIEPEKPEVIPEEVESATIKVTELQIVEDAEVREEDEIVTIDEQIATDASAGTVTHLDGSTNKNIFIEHRVEIKVEPEPVAEPKTEEIFKSVEQMPQFPGGEAALMKFLSSHINYPPMAAENNVQGKVIVQFVVDKTGKVGEVKVVRNVDKDLDNEAIRVCKALPKFTPGRQNGRPVSVWYTLPIQFKLQGTN